ncbi:TIGR03084 family metal-binding protein [Umezawaea sp. Da 62-37]|uniref:TIGR03084 family metal-binding protein n=1 Tax=Umezawaea sp. Da 62-37 TaxID=3075927 RepID=UPI0028F6E475|nr:TIGR03084 family metal-binding protein [Umezawaea sp. Da 62-37]WNV84586.1 TIGR03084 family metal-binding protein [Umezawaea sp. Da 62-37]
MTEPLAVISALKADAVDVQVLLSDIDDAGWTAPTPAPGWTVAHQVAHLAATFQRAGLAAADPDAFREVMEHAIPDLELEVAAVMRPYLELPRGELLVRWYEELVASADALAAVPAGEEVPWLVNPLPPAVLASGGMMELFAHGQDIADALGRTIERTDRIANLVGFIVHTRPFGYLARGQQPPADDFRFEVTAPSGALWTFGPPDATQRVEGPALDLCLLAARRRHHEDLALVATGEHAEHWLEIAQAYRGPAGAGRLPGQFAPVARG